MAEARNDELTVEEGTEVKKLRKSDLIKQWLLVYSSEGCYNYERLQALGAANAMVPIVKRLYDKNEDRVKALKKYMVFLYLINWRYPLVYV